MSYAQYESTPHLGCPVELFDFIVEGEHYRYVSHDEDVTLEGYLWSAAIISRSSFSKGSELARTSIDVSTTLDLPVVTKFVGGMPESQVQLWVYRVHLTDPDLQKIQIWTGQITTLKRSDRNMTLKGEIPDTDLKSVGLRRRIQRTCPHPLYGIGCFVNKQNYLAYMTVTEVLAGGKQLGTNIADCSLYIGGLLSALVAGHWKYRFVSNGHTNYVFLAHPAPWIAVGTVLAAYPGCNTTTTHCSNRFNNLVNFGGFPYLTSSDLYSTRIY
jgi:uncharacterized phage protein (TIGR02218 family)